MLAVLLLRRVAYRLLALHRSVTLRSDECRATPWKVLPQLVRDVLVAAAEEQLAGLRLREVAAAARWHGRAPTRGGDHIAGTWDERQARTASAARGCRSPRRSAAPPAWQPGGRA